MLASRPTPILLAALLSAASLGAAAPSLQASERVSGRDRFAATARVLEVRPIHVDAAVRESRLDCAGGPRRDVRVNVYGARPGYRPGHRFEHRPSHRPGYRPGHRPATLPDRRAGPYGRERDRVGVRTATVAGAALGGLVGHRIARGESDGVRIGATVAGSLVGSGLARRAVREPARGARPGRYPAHGGHHGRGPGRERCVRVVETRTERRLSHYEVTYLFRGRTFRTHRDRDPGGTIDIDVSLPPSRR